MKNGTSPFNPKVDVFMPLYIGRYLQDTTELDATESGGYLHLLMYQWVSGPLPNNEKKLARIAKMTPDAWSIAKASVMHFMFLGSDGHWHQRALEKIKAEWTDKRQKAHDKAVTAARARWSKQRAKKTDAPSIASAMPYIGKEQVQEQKHPHPPRSTARSGHDHPKPRELGTNPRALGTNPRALRAAGAQKSEVTAKHLGNALGAPRQNGNAGNHAQGPAGAVAPPKNFVAPEILEGVRPSKTDPRAGPFQEEIFAYWRAQNPEHPKCPWGEAESRALDALLIKVPTLTLAQLRQALRNRAASSIPPAVFPGKWLRRILDYSDGPLDRFHKPLGPSRVM